MASSGALRALQDLICEKAEGRSRPQLATETQAVADRVWGEKSPFIDEKWVRDVQNRLLTPPSDGRSLRALLAALDIPLTDALKAIGYWPDLRLGYMRPASTEQLIVATLESAGISVSLQKQHGDVVVLRIRSGR